MANTMYSLAYPNIFNGSKINLYSDYEAIKSNLVLLLGSNRGGLFGDPHYGTEIKKILFDQAYQPIVLQLIKDDIFESINSYMPQITVNRDDIEIQIVDNTVLATINVTSNSGETSNLLEIELLTGTSNS